MMRYDEHMEELGGRYRVIEVEGVWSITDQYTDNHLEESYASEEAATDAVHSLNKKHLIVSVLGDDFKQKMVDLLLVAKKLETFSADELLPTGLKKEYVESIAQKLDNING